MTAKTPQPIAPQPRNSDNEEPELAFEEDIPADDGGPADIADARKKEEGRGELRDVERE